MRTWRQRVRALKTELSALYLAYHHPDTPRAARWAVALVVAYALSPIDLIPDVIPVLGYLDDLLLVPLGVALALRLIPPAVMAECRARVRAGERPPRPRWGAAMVVGLWLVLIWGGYALWRSHS